LIVELTEPRPRSFTELARFNEFIIFGVPVEITTEELVSASSAVRAVHIVSHSGAVKAPTTLVVMTFDKSKKYLNSLSWNIYLSELSCTFTVHSVAISVSVMDTRHSSVGRPPRLALSVLGPTVFIRAYLCCAPQFSDVPYTCWAPQLSRRRQ